MLERVLVFVVACAAVARAHDPYEAWASASVQPERLVLIVTMAQATAAQLIEPANPARAITAQNFKELHSALLRLAKGLFVLTVARKRLVAEKADVELTEENDIVFTLSFRRPPPGTLHFHAAFLPRLGQGYGSMLEVVEPPAKDLGWEKLSPENPNFNVTVPAAKPPR